MSLYIKRNEVPNVSIVENLCRTADEIRFVSDAVRIIQNILVTRINICTTIAYTHHSFIRYQQASFCFTR